jgi:hypothetical protein
MNTLIKNPLSYPRDHDALYFEPLGPHESPWRDDAQRIEEVYVDLRARRNVGHTKDLDESPRYLILNARHLLAMLHNGLDNLVASVRARVSRLVMFAHRGARFTYHHAKCEPGDVPGGDNGLYDRLRDAILRLRYAGIQAVPAAEAERL